MQELIDVFKALSDSARLRIMYLLLKTGEEICACEICDSLLEPQYAVSRNVKILKRAGLLKEDKVGKWVYYLPGCKSEIFYQALKSLPDPDKILKKDLERFKNRMKLREGGRCLIGVQNKELLS